MMPSFPSSPVCRFGTLAAVAALLWLAGGAAAQTIDQPDPGGTFTTPSFPQRNLPPGGPGSNAGTQPAQIGGRPGANANTNANANPAGPRNGRDLGDTFPRRTEPAPPPKSNEFQRFVEGATGRLLPIFGSAFFADAADNFQSLDNVPVSADYTIGPGDEIVTRAWGAIDVDYRSTVDRNGMLNLPKVGSFNVAGVKAADLEKNLRSQLARLYNNFELSVSLGQLRGLRVFVVGPAQRPGVFGSQREAFAGGHPALPKASNTRTATPGLRIRELRFPLKRAGRLPTLRDPRGDCHVST